MMTNTLGEVYTTNSAYLTDSTDFMGLRKAVPEKGVVVLKKQDMDVEQLISLTKRFGEPVLLPEGMRFNNIDVEHPEIARVSNILPNGEIIANHTAAEYWHNDGDFWQPVDNYIYNFLYCDVAPPVGGETAFVDLRLAYDSLPKQIKARIESLKIKVSCHDIPDFKDAKPEEMQPDAYHNVTHKHIETEAVGLYFGFEKATIDGVSAQESEEIMGHLLNSIENPEFQYVHSYEPGDLLIWDNTTVMHRGVGGYLDHPRLLYRTQAFIRAERMAA